MSLVYKEHSVFLTSVQFSPGVSLCHYELHHQGSKKESSKQSFISPCSTSHHHLQDYFVTVKCNDVTSSPSARFIVQEIKFLVIVIKLKCNIYKSKQKLLFIPSFWEERLREACF